MTTTTNGSDLVVQKSSVDAAAGAPLVQDAMNLGQDLGKDDGTYAAIDSALVGLDVLGVVLDPFGSLFGEVAGYIIEHVGFLNQFMDDLTGDPQGIEAASRTWKNIADNLTAAAQDYESALSSLSAEWDDAAATAYQGVATSYIGACYGVAGYAELFSEGVTLAGMLCAKTRQDVYDAIGDLITQLVIAGLAALATSWCSFGGSVAAWICDMEISGDMTAASISDKIASLLGKMGKFATKYAKDAETFGKLGDKLTNASKAFKDGAADSRKEAEELEHYRDGIGTKPAHRGTPGSGHGPGGGGRHQAPPEPSGGNPLESSHEGADVTVRGARDEVKSHRPEEGDGEGGKSAE